MKPAPRIPSATRPASRTSVDVYDQHGHYLCRLSTSPHAITNVTISGSSVALSTTDGHVKVYEILNGSAVYRFTR